MPPLLVAAIVVLLEGLAFGVILPVLPEFVERLGGGSAWAGIAFALATAPRVVCAPLWGKLSEIRGRRLSLVLVSLGTMSASIVWAYCGQLGEIAFGGLVWLMISRALYGLFAAQSVLGLAVASDVSTPEKRAGAMGVVGAAFGIAFTVGPWVGGEFAHAYSEAAVGWLMAAFQLGSVIVVLTLLKETHPEHAPGEVDERVEQAGVYVRPSRLMALVFAPAVTLLRSPAPASEFARTLLFSFTVEAGS